MTSNLDVRIRYINKQLLLLSKNNILSLKKSELQAYILYNILDYIRITLIQNISTCNTSLQEEIKR